MSTVGRYTLLRQIASGGMAEIWKAKAQGPAGFSKTVAIKKVLPHLVEDNEFIEMFIEEAKLVAELVHPNIVQVFDFGELSPREYFLAMEYVPGTNVARLLKRIVEKGGKLPAGVAIYIVAETARGLHAAHSKTDSLGNPLNIVHRDISPQNILLSYSGEVKVSDFGIARAASAAQRTQEGMVRGKLTYMSPEQATAKPLDGRSDLFALGIILWELLTRKRLFAASSVSEIYARVSQFQGLSPEETAAVPPALLAVVSTALDPNPDRRYQSGLEFETALLSLLGAKGQVKAREMLSSMMGNLFDEERRIEATPAAAFGAGSIGGDAVVGAMAISESIESHSGPISSLTLEPKAVVMQNGDAGVRGSTPGRDARRGSAFAALGAGAMVVVVLAFLGLKGLVASGKPAPATTPGVAVALPTTAKAVATMALPVKTVAQPAHTAVARASEAPVPATTSAPSAKANGSLSVKSRPWVQVWVDGRMVTRETPLREFRIAAGPHQFRFLNDAMHFDASKSFSVPANGELSISIDVAKKTIAAQ